MPHEASWNGCPAQNRFHPRGPNRLPGKTYSNGDPAVGYFYDQTSYNGLTITNGLGRRTGTSDGSGQAAWSYNADGNVLTERRTIAGVTKSVSYTYNQNGSIALITYPSGMIVGQEYNTAARLTRITCQASGSNCYQVYFAESATYVPQGA